MTLGLVGLGKMGQAIGRKLAQADQTVIGFDADAAAREAGASACTAVVEKASALVSRLPPPRILWLMVPAGAVDDALSALLPELAPPDLIVDGGNSRYIETQRRAADVEGRDLAFVDVGVSGGPRGGSVGFSLMVGGDPATVGRIQPLLEALARPSGAWGHLGPAGAGHFVKMVHNGVEYGIMEALAEGVDVLAHGPFPALNLAEVARVWRSGSVVRSYLVDLLADILATEDLAAVRGVAVGTGEGQWTVETARAHALKVPVIEASVARRAESQQRELFAAKILALLRNRFGGHKVQRGRKETERSGVLSS